MSGLQIPNTNTAGLVFVSLGDGTGAGYWTSNSGSSAITSLTGDVTAAGPGASAASVVRIQGLAVASTTPTANQTWQYDASTATWRPSNVTEIQGTAITTTAPSLNEVLQYNGSQWTPAGLSAPSVAGSFSSTVTGPVSVSTTDTQLTSVSVSGYTLYLVIANASITGSAANTADIYATVGGSMIGIASIGSFSANAYGSLSTSFPYVAANTGSLTIGLEGHVPGSGTVSFANINLTVLAVTPTITIT